MTITGACFCGEITYEVNGVLCDARSCHCSRCRRVSALAKADALRRVAPTSVLIDRENIRYLGSLFLVLTFHRVAIRGQVLQSYARQCGGHVACFKTDLFPRNASRALLLLEVLEGKCL